MHHSSCIIHHASFIMHHSSCIIHHASFIMHHSLQIIHHASFIALQIELRATAKDDPTTSEFTTPTPAL
jgi:hypothetical protein